MAHDASKVLMGMTQSSSRQGTQVFASDPATYLAGLAVRKASTGLLTLAKASGGWAGISLGRSLSDHAKTVVLGAGELVPLQLTAAFTPVIGAVVHISDTTGKAGTAGAGFTASNAVYASGVLTGLAEDGTEVDVALVDMVGGL